MEIMSERWRRYAQEAVWIIFARLKCGCRECEDKVKEYAQATSRVMLDEEGVPEKCAICGKPAKHKVVFARAY